MGVFLGPLGGLGEALRHDDYVEVGEATTVFPPFPDAKLNNVLQLRSGIFLAGGLCRLRGWMAR
jgi:hypothetical protein